MSVTAPYIDDAATYAPSFIEQSTVAAPFLDSGVGFAPTITEVDPAAVEVWVNGAPVADTFARSFREEIADVGSFSFSLLAADFTGVAFDDLVQFRLDGQPVFLGVVEQITHVALAQGEEADQVVNVSGRGGLALLDQAVAYPSRGVGALPIEEVRSFSWVSIDFDASSWPFAKIVNTQRSYADTDSPRPYIWPDITGRWIWGNVAGVTHLDAPQGICLFRKTFTLADPETVRIFCAGDNVMRIWVDGAEMTWFAGSAVGRYIEIELGDGDHVIACKVANKVDVPGEDNPAGLILIAYTVNSAGLLDTKILESSTTWRCLPYPVRAPGFSHGKTLRFLIEEAQADGALDGVELDFTDTLDSGGDEWGYFREVTVGVGRHLTDVVREMSDAFIDVAFAPGSKTLRAWNRGGRGVTRSLTLQQTTDPATSDFLELRHEGARTRTNQTLIRFADGHLEETDTASIATYDTRMDYLELGDIEGEAEALEIARVLQENRSSPSWATTARLLPHNDAATPYKGFEVGDTINCPDEDGTPVPMRVRSIAMIEADDGVVEWGVELRDQRFELEERHDAWLRRVAAGFAVGGARVSSRAGTPAPTAQQISTLTVARFSQDGPLTTGRWPSDPAAVSGNIVEVFGEITEPGTTTTEYEVYKGATLLATLNFGAGDTEDSKPVNIVPVRANVDKLYPDCTVAGTGAEGVVIQIRAV